jgi:PAS domain S-box-containing protein
LGVEQAVSGKQFFILVEGTADPAFAVNGAGQITAWNSAAVQLFGFSETEAVGARCHQLLQCGDDNGIFHPERCVIERVSQANHPQTNFDLRVQTKTGKQWCNLSTFIASDESGAHHAIHIVRPRELRKRLEQAMGEFVRTRTNGASVRSSEVVPSNGARLTSRELEVLGSLAKGHTTKKIANQFNISAATVNNHIKHILTKLGAHSRLEAIRNAERAGVI